MIYIKDITTSILGAANNPKKTTLKVTKGLVYRMEVCLPPGPWGLLHVSVFDGGYQVWPYEFGESFKGDAETISFDDIYLKFTEPFEFNIYTYNQDTVYEHWCQIRIGLVSEEAFMARYVPHYGYEEFKKIIENLLIQQEQLRSGVVGKPFEWMLTPTEE